MGHEAMECDLLVIGSGMAAGLSAAGLAAERSARVVVVEKASTLNYPPNDPYMNSDNFILVCASSIERDVHGTATLIGNQCADCGETYFPAASGCTRCTSANLNRFNFGRHGTLWTWTIQSFLPKPPYNSGETDANFKPYGVGYIEMPGGIKIESRLSVADADKLAIGMPMTMSLETYGKTPEGANLVTFVFSPAESDINGAYGNE